MITAPEIQVDDVASHYDELDRFYRELWGEHVHHGLWLTGREGPEQAVRQLIVRVADELGVARGDRICDVGCGYGGTSRYLVSEYGARVTGLTVSSAQFQYAIEARNGSENPEFLLQDWQTNTLDAASFDGLVSIECVSHVNDKQVYFDQIYRVLRPGGRAVVVAWLTAEQPRGWHRRRLLEPICREGRLPSMGSELEYTELVKSAGLRLLKFTDLSRQVRKTWSICGRRALWGLCTKSSYRRYLLSRLSTNAIFLKTVFRISLAYRTAAMRYGMFVLERPQ